MSIVDSSVMPIESWLNQHVKFGEGIVPYYFQNEAIIAATRDLDHLDSTAIVLPTGCGKTITFGIMTKYATEVHDRRVLVLAHRGELLEQAQQKLRLIGVDSVLEKAEHCGRTELQDATMNILRGNVRTVVASVATLQGKRLEKWDRDYFDLIITDEAHHFPAKSYQNIRNHFAKAKHIGATATFNRRDKINLLRYYQNVAYEYRLDQAIREGYLCRIPTVRANVEIDLRGIRTIGRDFNEADLADRIEPMIEQMANAVRENIGNRKGLIFTPCVRSAQLFSDALNSLKISSQSLNYQSANRSWVLESFRKNNFQVLCNCTLLTEGYDQPDISFIGLARATTSWGLLAQMVGRGTRPAQGKENCLILDYGWQVEDKHKLVRPVHLMIPSDEKVNPRSLKLAEEKTGTDGEPVDILEAWETSETQRKEEDRIAAEAAEKEREQKKREALERKKEEEENRRRLEIRNRATGWQYRMFDPVGSPSDLTGIRPATPKQVERYPITPRQQEILTRYGFHDSEIKQMSKTVAWKYVNWCGERKRQGKCTWKQAKKMIREGLDQAEALSKTKEEASFWISRTLACKEHAAAIRQKGATRAG